jgi:uncharacterized membrane protein HdeD (DUF308 family)
VGSGTAEQVGNGTEGGPLSCRRRVVIVIGLILLVLGLIFQISVLWTIGIIVLVIGAALWIAGATGHAVAGRRHYW